MPLLTCCGRLGDMWTSHWLMGAGMRMEEWKRWPHSCLVQALEKEAERCVARMSWGQCLGGLVTGM